MIRQLLRSSLFKQNFKILPRHMANGQSQSMELNEQKLTEILKAKFGGDQDNIRVADVSGGCGAMFEVFVRSSKFKNLPIVKQHQMVNAVLKEEVKQMHGIRIFTEAE